LERNAGGLECRGLISASLSRVNVPLIKIMKSPHILVIEAGSGRAAGAAPKSIVTSMTGSLYEVAELTVSCPVSEDEVARLFEVIAAWKPELLLLFLSGRAVVQSAAEFFEVFRVKNGSLPIVVVCPGGQPCDGVELLKQGASEVITVPSHLKEAIPRLLGLQRPADHSPIPIDQLRASLGLEHIIGESPIFVHAINQIAPIARYEVSVLILGETGTGKEVFARAIHYRSPRATKPFVPVNCGAIPTDLMENEFFGHESGAFTSANSSRRGVIKEADGGTLFLDEVDSLSPLAQVKLLRFLQDGQFRPLGSATVCSANVRVIAASNVHFADSLASGRFRKDLYYRLNVLSLKLPPLREREEDIVLLARHFLARYTEKFRTPVRELSPAALQKLLSYTWPGNVRELENVIQRAVILSDHTILPGEHILIGDVIEDRPEQQNFQQLKAKAINQFEASYIRRLLLVYDGNITKAAAGAGKDRRAFWELMRKHRIPARPSSSPIDRASP
jgi:two-component system response regulator GlrR